MPVATIIKPNESKSTSKVRYTITYSSWSSTVNADGYYTYALSLTRPLKNSIAPTVYIAGSSNTSQPTDTHKTMFSYVERCYLSGSTLTLYAKTKPTSTFYIWVEGVAGSGSGSIVGNVIQPNGGGGINYSTTEHVIGTWIDGKTLYEKTIDFGSCPNNTSKSVECLLGGYHVVSIEAVMYNINGLEHEEYLLPYYNPSNNRSAIVYIYTRWLYIQTNYDYSNYNAVVTLRYTKS